MEVVLRNETIQLDQLCKQTLRGCMSRMTRGIFQCTSLSDFAELMQMFSRTSGAVLTDFCLRRCEAMLTCAQPESSDPSSAAQQN